MKKTFLTCLILLTVIFTSTQNTIASDPIKLTLQEWSKISAENIFDLNFKNFDQKMLENEVFFTEYGFSKFSQAIKNARYKENIERNELILKAYILCAPIINKQENNFDWIKNKSLSLWSSQFPMKLTWLGPKGQRTDYLFIRSIVSNGNEQTSDKFGYEQWVGYPSSAEDAEKHCEANA